MSPDLNDAPLSRAADELRSQLDLLDTPEFSPRRPVGPVVALAVLMVALAGGAFLAQRDSAGTIVETPIGEGMSVAEKDPAAVSTTDRSTTPPVADRDLVFGQDDTPPSPDWVKPELYETYQDPVYGLDIRRMTSADGTRFDRNTYSRRQAENADGTMFMTYHGEAEYRVYDQASGSLIRSMPIHPDGDPQWHATDPDLLWHVAGKNSAVGDLRLYQSTVSTGETTVVADLTERLQASLPGALYLSDRAEGSPSIDGERYAWIVYNDEEIPIGVVSYDVGDDAVLGVLPLSDQWEQNNDTALGRLDYVSMSPSGQYVVFGYWNSTLVYNADLTNERVINLKGDHSDIALDASGGDAYVYIDFGDFVSDDAGYLVSVDLDTLERTRLFRVYGGANTSVHVSGKGYNKPGWVVVSTYSCKDAGAWTCHKVMAVELAPEGRIVNLAHTYNCGEDYWTEAHAVVNRDFTRVYFNSDGGSCGIDAEVYEITVPFFD